MIIGIGVDICDLERFATVEKRTPGAAVRILTAAELATAPRSRAARFAAKEALAKALGAPGLRWLDAEVVTGPNGQPRFEITGTVADRCRELGVTTIHLSLSHDAGAAVAFVVCEGTPCFI